MICPAHLTVLICSTHLTVRHQEGLDRRVMALDGDPIGDGSGRVGHKEALFYLPAEALQQRPGQDPQGAVEVVARLGLEGHLAGVNRV